MKLRRNLKIKSSILVIAWIVIFLHGVIPHDHHEPDMGSAKTTCCSHAAEPRNNDHSDQISAESFSTESHSVCHFNPDMLGSVDSDCIFLAPSAMVNAPINFSADIVTPCGELHLPGTPYYRHSPGRAPPATS